MASVLTADGLTVLTSSGERIIEDARLSLEPGEILGVVGESGSGKTTLSLALLGYAMPGLRLAAGSVQVDGIDLTGLSEAARRGVRGRLISYVPQDPATSLNPSRRVGDAIGDVLRVHGVKPTWDRISDALDRMHLPATTEFARRFPHQLSGGQQQRVAIASATICEPAVVVFDEPTTGLDVITQAHILDEIERLQRGSAIAAVYVSHDLAVVAKIASRILVMYAGQIVETAPMAQIIGHPAHPYTARLIGSIPDHRAPKRLLGLRQLSEADKDEGCAYASRCPHRVARCLSHVPELRSLSPVHTVRCFEAERIVATDDRQPITWSAATESTPLLTLDGVRAEHRSRRQTVVAASSVSFEVARGQCVALVGESGSGKTTLGRCIAGLHPPAAGRIEFDGKAIAGQVRKRSREEQRRIQIVFQNPYETLNPRRTVEDQVARPAIVLRGLPRDTAVREARQYLERMHLPERLGRRYPKQLSGGERQRVALARALIVEPDLLICDEITSALDVTVQASIIELLRDLETDLHLAMLFISHNLGVVSTLASKVVVLNEGIVCEYGDVESVLINPKDDYTRDLLSAAPRLAATGDIAGVS